MKDNHAWSPDMDEAVNPHKYEPTAQERVKAVWPDSVHASTAMSLIRFGIIASSDEERIMNKVYTLTDLGKSIEL